MEPAAALIITYNNNNNGTMLSVTQIFVEKFWPSMNESKAFDHLYLAATYPLFLWEQ